MITKIKSIIYCCYINSLFFLLSGFILKVNADTKIIATRDDTLLKLSKQYNVPLKELMHKNSFNYANRKIEGEVIIIPTNNSYNKKNLTHKVIAGDTLYRIAKDYNVKVKDILILNNIDNTMFLSPNQIIKLPSGAIHKKLPNKQNIKFANKKVFYHQTSKIEYVSEIAQIHKVPKEKIISLNRLKDTIKVNPNTKIKIRNINSLNWQKYGSILINWSDWTYLDGYYTTQAKNKKNNFFLLAISCESRVLNNTLSNSYWSSWYFPKNDFEFKLINDFCDKDFQH